MLIMPYPHQWNDIERYCKILDKLVVLPLEPEAKYSFFPGTSFSKMEYEQKKQGLESYILQLLDKVNSVDDFSTALFIFRSVMKEKMYTDNFADWTPRFKVCNYLFFLSLKHPKHFKCTLHVASNDSMIVRKIFFSGYTFFYNQQLFNEQHFLQCKVSTDQFFQRIEQVTNRNGDMHSYQIKSPNLRKCLIMRNLTTEQIQKYALDKCKDYFLSRDALSKNISWLKMIRHDNICHQDDTIVIVPVHTFNRYDGQFRKFIIAFEAEKCQNPADTESDLIFAYKTDNYVYISKKLLYDTQVAVESFAAWGQYGNIAQYFWGIPVDQKTLGDYNRLMTYKIVDLLLVNGYVVPMEIVKGMSIPRIEVSDYTMDKRTAKKLGDIDVMFFSKYTRTLYLIEYKNYQMIVSREGDLSAEYSKVKREDTPTKVIERHKYIADHMEYCVGALFQSRYNVQKVKSVLLTTKPCYFFYVHELRGYDYMDWVEFEQQVINNRL